MPHFNVCSCINLLPGNTRASQLGQLHPNPTAKWIIHPTCHCFWAHGPMSSISISLMHSSIMIYYVCKLCTRMNKIDHGFCHPWKYKFKHVSSDNYAYKAKILNPDSWITWIHRRVDRQGIDALSILHEVWSSVNECINASIYRHYTHTYNVLTQKGKVYIYELYIHIKKWG